MRNTIRRIYDRITRRQVRRTLAIADRQVEQAEQARVRRNVAATLALVA